MFLDDELLELCRNAAFDEDGIQKLNVDVCTKCESYYKSKLYPTISKDELRVIMNKTFKLFDSFVRLAKADKDRTMQILGEMFEKHSFKKQLLSNPEMKRIYESL